MKVPFLDLTNPTQQIKNEYLKEIDKFLDRANFILTKEVKDFEESWAKKIGSNFCLGTSSGADALYLALMAVGIMPGDEVIIQGNAYNASVTAIIRTGAIPRFVDINQDSLTIDTSKIEALVGLKTKVILPVHLYGQPNDMEEIVKIAKKYNLAIVEDCAQAHLAEYKGNKVGNWGDVGAFSFYPTKNLGAFGDAGAVTTNDIQKYDEMSARRNLGQVSKNNHHYFGTNMRLDPIQAITLSLKLKYLTEATIARQKAAKYYNELFKQAKLPINTIKLLPDATHVYHLYVIRVLSGKRDILRQKMADLGVGVEVHYPTPVYRQDFYKQTFDKCPLADLVSEQIISLPLYPSITKNQQEYVVDCLKKSI